MTLQDLMPVIIPGFLIQLIAQAYYIHHCWNNPRLSSRQKFIYIFVIALFHLPAVTFYLFATRSSDSDADDPAMGAGPGSQTSQGIFIMLLIVFEIFAFRTLFMSAPPFLLISLLLGICFTALIVDGLLRQRLRGTLEILTGYGLSLLQIALVLAALQTDRSQNVQFLVLTVLAIIINRQPLRRGAILSVFLFVGYVLINVMTARRLYGSLNSEEVISSLYVQILSYLLIFIVFYSLKWQLQTNHRLTKALRELRLQSLELEKMSAEAERSRVVGEIHDTVGHTLTTAVITMEAAENLLKQDSTAALERYLLAGQQIRTALQELRSSVRTIQSGIQQDFQTELQNLLAEVKKNTGLNHTLVSAFDFNLEPLQQTILMQAIRECLTNSLKHGRSDHVDILIEHSGERLQLSVSDDGQGCASCDWGFGLENMRRQIEAIGGTLRVDSEPDEGFTVSIAIPFNPKNETKEQVLYGKDSTAAG